MANLVLFTSFDQHQRCLSKFDTLAFDHCHAGPAYPVQPLVRTYMAVLRPPSVSPGASVICAAWE